LGLRLRERKTTVRPRDAELFGISFVTFKINSIPWKINSKRKER